MKRNGSSPVAWSVKSLPAMQVTQAQSLSREDPLEKDMATHSSILAWKIPWTEPGGLQSMGSQSQTQLSDEHTKQSQTHGCRGQMGRCQEVGSWGRDGVGGWG